MLKPIIALCLLHQPATYIEPVTTPITVQDVGGGANSDYEPTVNATLHLRCTPGRALFIAGTMTEQRRTIPEATGPLGLGYVDCPDSGQLRYSDELGGPGLRPGWATVTFTVQDGGYGGPAVARVARWVVIPR